MSLLARQMLNERFVNRASSHIMGHHTGLGELMELPATRIRVCIGTAMLAVLWLLASVPAAAQTPCTPLFVKLADLESIEVQTALAQRVRESSKPACLFLNSWGGTVAQATPMRQGELRWRKFDVMVPLLEAVGAGVTTIVAGGAECASACATLWFAGAERCISRTAMLLVHSTEERDGSGRVVEKPATGSWFDNHHTLPIIRSRSGPLADELLRLGFHQIHGGDRFIELTASTLIDRYGAGRYFDDDRKTCL